jgi:hypothetical protein
MEILLVLLLTPVGAVASAAGWSLRARRRFAGADGAFRCKVRVARGRVPGLGWRWPRGTAHARWSHDVLLVHRGHWCPVTLALPARVIDVAPGWRIARLGRSTLLLSLQLDGGPIVEVVAAETDRTPLVGPFLAAAVPGPPQAQPERP